MGIKEAEEYRCKCLKPFRGKKTQKIMLMNGEKNKPF